MRRVVISEGKEFIHLAITLEREEIASWEDLQSIKDRLFENLVFIEVYPKKKRVINYANVRHLFHFKKVWAIPEDFSLLEDSSLKVSFKDFP